MPLICYWLCFIICLSSFIALTTLVRKHSFLSDGCDLVMYLNYFATAADLLNLTDAIMQRHANAEDMQVNLIAF